MGPDLTTAIVVGAVVGLFFVALGHAQLVWLARRTRGPAPTPAGTRLATLVGWSAILAAALAVLHAVTTRGLPDRPALLAGEGLLVVHAKPGLVAAHLARGAEVRRGEPLLRFTGQDGEEARTALRARRQQVAVQLASERMRPLDYDGETLRRAEAARAALQEHERRAAQLESERDAIEREMTSQQLALESRRFGLENDARDAARELEPLAATLGTERGLLAAQESLAARGMVARLDADRARDAVLTLEARVRRLRDRRELLARELGDLSSLRTLALGTLERQLGARAVDLRAERAEIATAQRNRALAEESLEGDRPRAEAERRRRLDELERQLAECDGLLDGRGAQLAVTAPWDGRLGFRDPTPEATPADGGPLLVAYRPDAITAALHLGPAEAHLARGPLDARIAVPAAGFASSAGPSPADIELVGRVIGRAQLADGAVELRVACDPPDRVVRRLAMGGSVPVVGRLQRPLVHTGSFQLAVALVLVAAALALHRPARSLLARRRRGGRGGGTSAGAAEPGWAPAPPTAPAWPVEPALPSAAAVATPAEVSAGGSR